LIHFPEISPLTIISGGDDCEIKIWNALNFNLRSTLQGHKLYITTVIYLGNNLLASASADKTLRIWDISSREPIIKPCNTYLGLNNTVIIRLLHIKNYNENYILMGSIEENLRIFDLKKGECVHVLDKKTKWSQNLLDLNHIETNLIAFASTKYLKLYNIDTCKEVKKLKGHKERIEVLNYFQRDSKDYLISSGWDRLLNIWNINKSSPKDSELIVSVIASDSLIKNLFVAQNYIFVYGIDKKGRLWNINYETKEIKLHKNLTLDMNCQFVYVDKFNKNAITKQILVSMSDGTNLINFKITI